MKYYQGKLAFIAVSIVALSLAFFMSCTKNDVFVDDRNVRGNMEIITNSQEDYKVEFNFGKTKLVFSNSFVKDYTNSGNISKSKLNVFKNDEVVYESAYVLDTTVRDYKLLQHKKIEKTAESLDYNLNENDYECISLHIKNLLEDVFNSGSARKRHIQSLFFHLAIVNTKLRQKQSGNIECVPHPSYILDKCFFWYIQDYSVDVKIVKAVFVEHPDLLKEKSNQRLLDLVNNYKEDKITYDKIYFSLVSKRSYLETIDQIFEKNSPNYQ